MTIPSFAERRKAWGAPPVDDVGYILSSEMLTWDDETLNDVITKMAESRYGGWRNYQMRWRNVLRLDKTQGKNVLDYGCGVGLEALQYAKGGNSVSIADISLENVQLAKKVLAASGYNDISTYRIFEKSPYIRLGGIRFDVIHCCGVLHHIPEPTPIVEAMASWLVPQGELRLMVYSDEAWKIATKTEPPDGDVYDYVEFEAFWQHWDPIGGYADWYNREKLEARFGEWFTVERCEPLTEHGEYIGAILMKR